MKNLHWFEGKKINGIDELQHFIPADMVDLVGELSTPVAIVGWSWSVAVRLVHQDFNLANR